MGQKVIIDDFNHLKVGALHILHIVKSYYSAVKSYNLVMDC